MTDLPDGLTESLRRLLAAIEAGDLVASTATRYRIEGAVVALEALAGADPETIFERLGLKDL